VARLKGPKASKGPVPYHTSVRIDATGSKNVSRYGVRWEVRDGTGSVLIESPRILVTSVVSKRRHMLCNNCQNSLQLAAPIHICVILSRGG
jgi:hypothetical protein